MFPQKVKSRQFKVFNIIKYEVYNMVKHRVYSIRKKHELETPA